MFRLFRDSQATASPVPTAEGLVLSPLRKRCCSPVTCSLTVDRSSQEPRTPRRPILPRKYGHAGASRVLPAKRAGQSRQTAPHIVPSGNGSGLVKMQQRNSSPQRDDWLVRSSQFPFSGASFAPNTQCHSGKHESHFRAVARVCENQGDAGTDR